MNTKFSKTDILFLAALLTGLLVHIILSFSLPFLPDESFYATIPYRLLQGDSLFRQEWHLSQMSSLFTYPLVWIWMKITGSADGLLIFLRYVYIAVYTAAALITYLSFRKYGKWAVAAVILFYTQTPYRILSLNYNSVYTVGALMLALCLLALSERTSPRVSFTAGLCAGCCCVCNPLFAGIYVLYFFICVSRMAGKHNHSQEVDTHCGRLFCKEAMLFSLLGISCIALVLIAFFFLTGGTVLSLFNNIPLLLQSTEYSLTAYSFLEKLKTTWTVFTNITLGMPFLFPLMYLVMLLDPKKYTYSRRCLYLFLALIAGGISVAGILLCVYSNNHFTQSLFFSLPLLILTTTCYILTEKKNTRLFTCMWLPCVIAACVQYMAANTILTSLGFVLAVANIAGVLFAGYLYREMAENSRGFSRRLICAGLCLQMLFHMFICIWGQLPPLNSIHISTGPHAGMYATRGQSLSYHNALSDLDYIRSTTPEDAPLLIVSYYNWMYLYADRPVAIHTTWFEETLQADQLISYYQQNPDKIPRYIYVDSTSYGIDLENWDILSDLFVFTSEELSRGFLLTVEYCKFQ